MKVMIAALFFALLAACTGEGEPGPDAGLSQPPGEHTCLVGWHWQDGKGCVRNVR